MDLKKLKNKSDNPYSKVLFIIGWAVIIFGFFVSFMLGCIFTGYEYGEFSFTLFFAGLVTSFVSGFLILGLAEIIGILHDNRRLLASIAAQKEGAGLSTVSNTSSIEDELPEI